MLNKGEDKTDKKNKTENKKPKTCQARRYDNKTHCERPLYDDYYCKFHSRDVDGKKDKFNEEFNIEFERQKKEDDVFDFSGFIFPDSVSFRREKFNKNIYFKRVEFLGQSTSFQDAEFSGEFIDFRRAKFYGALLDFSSARFSAKEVDFGEVEFSSKYTNFNGILFSGERIHFIGATFSERGINGTNFSGATFEGAAFFNAAGFHQKNINFTKTEFLGRLTAFDGAFFFEKINIYNSYFKNVEGLFEILRGKPAYLTWKKVLPNVIKTNINILKKPIILFDILKYKLTFLRKVKYRVVDFRFRLGEESAIKYPVIKRMTQDEWFLADFKKQHKHIHRIWNLTSKCGQSFARWALLSLIIVFLFGAIYADYSCPSWLKWIDQGKIYEKINPILILVQPNTPQKEKHSVKWRIKTDFTPYYFSIVTFTTLGFGDVIPANLAGEIWLTIEVIVGYIMLGGLISIFAVKFAKRS